MTATQGAPKHANKRKARLTCAHGIVCSCIQLRQWNNKLVDFHKPDNNFDNVAIVHAYNK